MNIADLCRRDVVTIREGATLQQAAVLMCEQHVGALVVIDDDALPRVTGIVTDRDIVLDAVGRAGDVRDLRMQHLVKAHPISVQSRATLGEAAEIMAREGVRRLLVVDDSEMAVGLVSADDLVTGMAEELQAVARALRKNLKRERFERHLFGSTAARRPVLALVGQVRSP